MSTYPSSNNMQKEKIKNSISNETGKEVNIHSNAELLKLEALNNRVIDEFEIDRIESIIREIEETDNLDIEFNAEKSFEKFKESYLDKAISQKDILEKLKSDADNKIAKYDRDMRKKIKFARFVRFAASFVVIAFIFNSASIVIADINWFRPLIDWTTETFNLKTENGIENPTILGDGQSLYSDFKYIENDYSVTLLKPSYIPKGYKLVDIMVFEKDDGALLSVTAKYENEESFYLYVIEKSERPLDINSIINSSSERKLGSVEEFDNNHIHFYIFENDDWPASVWTHKNFNYNTYGTVLYDEFKEIIKSVK